jgi:hypothetical protein
MGSHGPYPDQGGSPSMARSPHYSHAPSYLAYGMAGTPNPYGQGSGSPYRGQFAGTPVGAATEESQGPLVGVLVTSQEVAHMVEQAVATQATPESCTSAWLERTLLQERRASFGAYKQMRTSVC